MANNHSLLRDSPQDRWPRQDSADEIQYLLKAEEQLLRSISARMPLAEILPKICDALNSEIGNVVSLVSLPDDDAAHLAMVVKSATLFGLHKFCSARVDDGNAKSLGSLEMYSCVPRRPFLGEVRLIERAACLAAIAIQHHREEANHGESCSTTLNREASI